MLSHEIRLKSYPKGLPTLNDFETIAVTIDEQLNDQEFIVRNLYMSVDPYMRSHRSI